MDLIGFGLGLRHAFEPDHIAAVSSFDSTQRGPRGAWLGISWGIGHAASLLSAGAIGIACQRTLSSRQTDALELLVGLLLIALGLRSLCASVRHGAQGSTGLHQHGRDDPYHAHHGPLAHFHVAGRVIANRPLLLGILHGLAGSGSLLVVATGGATLRGSALAYLTWFGLGSIIGMACLTWAGARLHARLGRARTALAAVGSGVSLVVGIAWAALAIARLCA